MNYRDEQKIRSVERWTKKIGKADYLKYLRGGRLTQQKAIRAKCYDCCCGEPDICSVQFCPLLPFNLALHKIGDAGSDCGSAGSE